MKQNSTATSSLAKPTPPPINPQTEKKHCHVITSGCSMGQMTISCTAPLANSRPAICCHVIALCVVRICRKRPFQVNSRFLAHSIVFNIISKKIQRKFKKKNFTSFNIISIMRWSTLASRSSLDNSSANNSVFALRNTKILDLAPKNFFLYFFGGGLLSLSLSLRNGVTKPLRFFGRASLFGSVENEIFFWLKKKFKCKNKTCVRWFRFRLMIQIGCRFEIRRFFAVFVVFRLDVRATVGGRHRLRRWFVHWNSIRSSFAIKSFTFHSAKTMKKSIL